MKKYLIIGIAGICAICLVFGLSYNQAINFVGGQINNLSSITSRLFGVYSSNIPVSAGKDIDLYPELKNILPSSLFNNYGFRVDITVDDRAYNVQLRGDPKTKGLRDYTYIFDNAIRVDISLYDEYQKAYNYQVYILSLPRGNIDIAYLVTKDLYNGIGVAESLSNNISEWFDNPIEEYLTTDFVSVFGQIASYDYSYDFISVTSDPINLDFLES